MKFDPKTIKKDFPMFREGRTFAYLDSAATSQTPQVVLDAMHEYYTKFRANIHRGLYEAGEDASTAYENARAKIARFIGAEPREVIFTAGATASSNMLVAMLEHSGLICEGDLPATAASNQSGTDRRWQAGEIVTTAMEHHASLIPLQELAKRYDLDLKHIPLAEDSVELDYTVIEKFITEKTKIVSVMLASNVTGTINDVRRIADIAHKVGAMVICDATAAAGHMDVDVKKLGVDFLYFSGHKMCGPTGVGVLWGRGERLEDLEPGFYGGGIVEEVTFARAAWTKVPDRFEAGTPNIAGVIGLGAAVDYLEKVGIEHIRAHSMMLAKEAMQRFGNIEGVRVIAEKDVTKNVGIVSFVIKGIHPHDVADILGKEGVAVRAGHHCAMPFVTDALGLPAVVRASFYFYNTSDDIDALVRGIEKAKEIFGVK